MDIFQKILNDVHTQLHDQDTIIYAAYNGIAVRVDPNLIGQQQYLMVSQEVFDTLKRLKNRKEANG